MFVQNPNCIKTWENISVEDLHKLLIEEFGVKITDVASVLKQFGPSRLSKSCETSVSEFYFDWYSQLPEIMKPTSDAEYKNFADLMHRALFYLSLNDTFLQKALVDLKTPTPSLRSYVDEAIAADSRRKCFEDIKTSSSNLDNQGGEGNCFKMGPLIPKVKTAISKWQAISECQAIST